MEFHQISEYRICIVDRGKARLYLSIIAIAISLITIAALAYIRFKDQNIQSTLVSMLFPAVFLATGIYGLLSQQGIICDIDKSADFIRITYEKRGQRNSIYLTVRQIVSVGLKEAASIHYYTYSIGFITDEDEYIPLSIYSYTDQNKIRILSGKIAQFLAVEVQFIEADQPIIPIPPGF